MEAVGIPAASWVVGKALRPLSGGLLEAWGASSMLGSNMEVLKMQLLYAQAMLNNVRGREINNPALGELLDKLRQLAYGAEDVLDELDYFRIQDELDGTYHAADTHAAGCIQDLALNARHTAQACLNKLKLPMCSRDATHDEQDEGSKQGYLSGLRFCGSREIRSSPSSPANQVVEEVHGGGALRHRGGALDKGARGGPSAPHLPPGSRIFVRKAAEPPCRATQAYQPQDIKDLIVFGHPVAAQPSELSAGIRDLDL